MGSQRAGHDSASSSVHREMSTAKRIDTEILEEYSHNIILVEVYKNLVLCSEKQLYYYLYL